MRKFLFSIAAFAALLSACQPGGPSADDVAGRAAKLYYDYLLRGDYDAYVDGFYRPDSIPATYRDQLLVNARQFMAEQRDERGGITAVQLLGAQAGTARHVANAFLLLSYGDSTREEVLVPMVLHRGTWVMR